MTATAIVDRIRRELEELSRDLWRRVALLGLARLLIAGLLGAMVLFALDRLFTPPAAIRLVLSLVWVVGMAVLVRRLLLIPLAGNLSAEEMAIALERHFPDLHQQLISGVQLGGRERAGTSRELVEALLVQVEERFRGLPLQAIFDPKPTRWSGLAALGAGLVVVVGLVLAPRELGIWSVRMLGLGVSYPKATRLFLQLPAATPTLRVLEGEDRVILARGADLPVGVRVEGRVPPMVLLVGSDGSEETMAPKDERRFRYTYRGVTAPFSFHARGGDDDEGNRTIRVEVIPAPAVEGITATVTPPAYTGQAPTTLEGGHVEALVGSRVELAVRSSRPVKQAKVAFDSRTELTLAADPQGVLRAAFEVTRNDRYRVRLEGLEGLKNVRPGSYLVMGLPDNRPKLTISAPNRPTTAYTLQGTVPVRCRVQDDYGLADATLVVASPAGTPLVERKIRWTEKDPGTRRDRVLIALVPVKSFAYKEASGTSVGDTCLLRIAVRDNRAGKPGETRLGQDYRLDLVEVRELKRKASDWMRRRRTEVEGALRSQVELIRRLEATLEIDPGRPSYRTGAQGIQNGQARLTQLARRIRVSFADAFDYYLFGGAGYLEENLAELIMGRWRDHYAASPDRPRSDPAFYLALQGDRERLGISRHPGLILDLIRLCYTLENEIYPGVERQLAQAISATTPAAAGRAGKAAGAGQAQARRVLTLLLQVLEEWNEFDDVLQKLRGLMDAQRHIWGRTVERIDKPGRKDDK